MCLCPPPRLEQDYSQFLQYPQHLPAHFGHNGKLRGAFYTGKASENFF